ncbi:MAG: hypothetical protein U0228_35380 [Myxococcaceae bacterium]
MSIDQSSEASFQTSARRSPFTTVLLAALSFALCGCGVDAEPPAVASDPAPLAPATPAAERIAPRALAPIEQLRPETALGLRPSDSKVHFTTSLAEGTQVQFLLGELGCGIMVVAQGTATVHGGGFDVPYDPDNAQGMSSTTVFFRVATGATCDEASPAVFATQTSLPGVVDLDSAQPTYAGCWLFGTP